AGVVFVPTVAVYRETAQASRDGEIPAFIGDRAARAADHHLEAIAIARAAGLAIAVGTDAGTPRQHGANLNEIAALIDAGLTPEEAVDAATVVGARLLWGDQGLLFGDAILLERDPRTTDAYRAGSVAAVLQGGRLVHVADRAAWRLTAPASEPPCPT
ncbi:MAG: amidohydrolase family protein, partial [Actinobacteria bacterium]|nr:amidohydrolase family protein [Actinomycetota bacterium]